MVTWVWFSLFDIISHLSFEAVETKMTVNNTPHVWEVIRVPQFLWHLPISSSQILEESVFFVLKYSITRAGQSLLYSSSAILTSRYSCILEHHTKGLSHRWVRCSRVDTGWTVWLSHKWLWLSSIGWTTFTNSRDKCSSGGSCGAGVDCICHDTIKSALKIALILSRETERNEDCHLLREKSFSKYNLTLARIDCWIDAGSSVHCRGTLIDGPVSVFVLSVKGFVSSVRLVDVPTSWSAGGNLAFPKWFMRWLLLTLLKPVLGLNSIRQVRGTQLVISDTFLGLVYFLLLVFVQAPHALDKLLQMMWLVAILVLHNFVSFIQHHLYSMNQDDSGGEPRLVREWYRQFWRNRIWRSHLGP